MSEKLAMLDRIDRNGNAGGVEKAVRALKTAGLLARLEENVSGGDAWAFSALITKIKAL